MGLLNHGRTTSVLPTIQLSGDMCGLRRRCPTVCAGKSSSVPHESPSFVQNMTGGDAAACQLDHGLGWEPALVIIGIPRNGSDRSDLLQMFDHRPIADVPGMENVIDASEVSPDSRIELAMGISEHSDPNVPSCLSHSSTLRFSDSASQVWSNHCGTVPIYSSVWSLVSQCR